MNTIEEILDNFGLSDDQKEELLAAIKELEDAAFEDGRREELSVHPRSYIQYYD